MVGRYANRTSPSLLIIQHEVAGADYLVSVETFARCMNSRSAFIVRNNTSAEIN